MRLKSCIHQLLVLIAVFSLDYWVTEIETYEQPDITALNEIIVLISTAEHDYMVASTEELN